MNEFLNIETLGTFAGMAAGTALLTQLIKWLFGGRVNPKMTALAVAGMLTLILSVLPNPITAESLLLAMCNWLVVTGAAAGAFDYAVKPLERLVKGNDKK